MKTIFNSARIAEQVPTNAGFQTVPPAEDPIPLYYPAFSAPGIALLAQSAHILPRKTSEMAKRGKMSQVEAGKLSAYQVVLLKLT